MKHEYRIDRQEMKKHRIICSAVQIYLYAEHINLNIIYPAFSSLESVTAAIALKLSE